MWSYFNDSDRAKFDRITNARNASRLCEKSNICPSLVTDIIVRYVLL